MRIVYLLFSCLLLCGFTIPDNCVERQLDPTELRFLRRVVAKVNRVAWYDIRPHTSYYVPTIIDEQWTPVSPVIQELSTQPKIILVVLDEYFLGRYEYGVLVDWTNMLAGRTTKPGTYKILKKDKDHYSKSYKTTDGRDTPMPNALQIYGNVWIHGGDAYTPRHISHDCINVVNDYAEKMFEWADNDTIVVIENVRSNN